VVYVGSEDKKVYALNAKSGAKLWSYTTGGYIDSSPAVANGVVYVGSYDKKVYALNASSGAKLWSYATGKLVDSSPAVANGVVYVASHDHDVYAQRQNRFQAVELRHRRLCGWFTRRGEWSGLRRLGRWQRVRLRLEVKKPVANMWDGRVSEA
jgi:glucose dehydrogenase